MEVESFYVVLKKVLWNGIFWNNVVNVKLDGETFINLAWFLSLSCHVIFLKWLIPLHKLLRAHCSCSNNYYNEWGASCQEVDIWWKHDWLFMLLFKKQPNNGSKMNGVDLIFSHCACLDLSGVCFERSGQIFRL